MNQIVNYRSYVDGLSHSYELKKRWRKGFQFSIEHGSTRSLGYKTGYSFGGYFNQYYFSKDALTLSDAEVLTYQHYLKVLPRLCKKNHNNARNCERRGYTNGCGFCKTCGLFVSGVFSIEQFCKNCSARTNWYSLDGKHWCKSCTELFFPELTIK